MTFSLTPPSIEALATAGLSAALACAISIYNIFHHLLYWTKPELQTYIVRILLMIPIYSLASILGLAFPQQSIYFDTIRDIYEAFVLYCFMSLLLVYSGGELKCVEAMTADPGAIQQPWPFTRFGSIPTNGAFLRRCKQAVLQFILIKPIMAIISIIMLLNHQYESYIYQTLLAVVYNISYSAALYMLVLFYLATERQLVAFNPIRKFASVKLIVFFTFWQTFVISKMPQLTTSESAGIQDYLLCIEMLFFSVLQYFAFNANEFYDIERIGFAEHVGKHTQRSDGDTISDTESTISSIDYNTNKKHFKQHMGKLAQTLDLSDVYHDTKRTFNPKYNQYSHYNAANNVEFGDANQQHNISIDSRDSSNSSKSSLFTSLFSSNKSSSPQLLTATEQLSARNNDVDDDQKDSTNVQSYQTSTTDPLRVNHKSNKYTLSDDDGHDT